MDLVGQRAADGVAIPYNLKVLCSINTCYNVVILTAVRISEQRSEEVN